MNLMDLLVEVGNANFLIERESKLTRKEVFCKGEMYRFPDALHQNKFKQYAFYILCLQDTVFCTIA